IALTFACWSGVRSSALVKRSTGLPRFCCQRRGPSFFAAGSCASPLETETNRATHAAVIVINLDFIFRFSFFFFPAPFFSSSLLVEKTRGGFRSCGRRKNFLRMLTRRRVSALTREERIDRDRGGETTLEACSDEF